MLMAKSCQENSTDLHVLLVKRSPAKQSNSYTSVILATNTLMLKLVFSTRVRVNFLRRKMNFPFMELPYSFIE